MGVTGQQLKDCLEQIPDTLLRDVLVTVQVGESGIRRHLRDGKWKKNKAGTVVELRLIAKNK
jgi:hypothetical protein